MQINGVHCTRSKCHLIEYEFSMPLNSVSVYRIKINVLIFLSDGVPSSSLNRRSPKRKDISDEDLFHAVEDVLPYIRTKQVLPKDSVVLQMAYHRNLLQKPFPLDVTLSDSCSMSSGNWLPARRDGRSGDAMRPRLFNPYFEEAKVTKTFHSSCCVIASLNSTNWLIL